MIATDTSPINFAASAFAGDGEVDEANLFMPSDVTRLDEATIAAKQEQLELAAALEGLLATPIDRPNDEGDAVAAEQEAGEVAAVESNSLETLFAKAKSAVRDSQQVVTARERLAKGGLSTKERLEIEAKVREWEARFEWEPKANVVLIIEQRCSCCSLKTSLFGGLLQRQAHRTKDGVRRWIATDKIVKTLDKETAVRIERTSHCLVCTAEAGFAFERAYYIDPQHERQLDAAP